MDLISREVAIEEFEDMVTSVSVYGESAEARYATNARIRFIEKLNSIPTIPAVPMDKLCEWLSSHAYKKTGYYITDPGEAQYAHEWEHDIREWMEGLDGTN